MNVEIVVYVLLIVVFLVLSAFFSSSEAAFLSFQKTRLSHLVNTNVPGAKRVSEMIANMERLLSTILLGNNLVNVAFSAIITILSVELLGGGPLAVGFATLLGTILLLIFGEIIPKSVAIRKSEKLSLLYARPLKSLEIALFPAILFLQWLSNITQNLLGRNDSEETITEGEILSMIDIGEAEGTVEPAEAEMLENVFRFGDQQVREVMTPRPEIVSIERGITLQEFLQIYAENTHTRFPVHKESRDDIVGIISAKDILRALATRGVQENESVTDIVRDVYFVPETKPVSELFEELRRTGHQMAICLDEYGGIAGLVTIKRLTEVIVGKVGEEGESPEEEYSNIRPNLFQIEGGMDIGEANEEMELNLPEGDYETIAGFVLSQLGEIPSVGDQFEYKNLLFRIQEMDRFRIESLLIRKKIQMDTSVASPGPGSEEQTIDNSKEDLNVSETNPTQTRGNES
ncbi:MAG TPA: HlyC/CorC family transporter [Dehalococcoidia bacterium]|nr:HlyC/CorC family transporter [Dehalococcoidia bacterium]